MKTAVYVRVSSKTQDTRSQEADLKRWAASEEAAGVRLDWHRDTFTGKTMARPGWDAVWLGVLRAEYSRVVVWRLDRLGRTAREVVPLLHELQARNVALVSLREGFDLLTPGGRLFATMLAGFAQYETEVRSERQLAGIAEAKAAGVKFGRPKGSKKPRKLDEARTGLILRLKAEGKGVAEIARSLSLSRPTVYAALASAGSGDQASSQ